MSEEEAPCQRKPVMILDTVIPGRPAAVYLKLECGHRVIMPKNAAERILGRSESQWCMGCVDNQPANWIQQ